MRIVTFILLALTALPLQAQNAQELASAKSILSQLQTPSIDNNREYCGLLMREPGGKLITTKAFRGSKARCRVRRIPEGAEVVASYHTHGAYIGGYDNEVPSLLDLQVEMEWGIDGYVSTPGGRFWHVDGRRGTVRMLCGLGCLPSDPNYRDQSFIFGKIRKNYDFNSLLKRTVRGAEDD